MYWAGNCEDAPNLLMCVYLSENWERNAFAFTTPL